jgi:hypothetical protein
MSRSALVAICAAWISACGSAQPIAEPVAVAEPPPADESVETTVTGPLGTSRCVLPSVVEAEPETRERGPRAHCVNHLVEESAVRTELESRFRPTITGGVVDVSFGCDRLWHHVRDVVVTRGGGHATSHTIYRLRRDPARRDQFVARVLEYRWTGRAYDEYTYEVADSFEVRRLETTVPAAPVDAALERVRTALTARIREIEPPPTPGRRGGGGFSSSGSFHVAITLTDEHGYELRGAFTGPESSGTQAAYLPLRVAAEALGPVLRPLVPAGGPINDEDRALFVETFTAARATFSEQFTWWVRERYVAMASRLGTPALARDLLALLAELTPDPDDERERTPILALRPGSEDRTRVLAVTALAALTGWDARHHLDGTPRPLDHVTADYLAECR